MASYTDYYKTAPPPNPYPTPEPTPYEPEAETNPGMSETHYTPPTTDTLLTIEEASAIRVEQVAQIAEAVQEAKAEAKAEATPDLGEPKLVVAYKATIPTPEATS
jgi:hypothetical protein